MPNINFIAIIILFFLSYFGSHECHHTGYCKLKEQSQVLAASPAFLDSDAITDAAFDTASFEAVFLDATVADEDIPR
jgi:hypothetical protein